MRGQKQITHKGWTITAKAMEHGFGIYAVKKSGPPMASIDAEPGGLAAGIKEMIQRIDLYHANLDRNLKELRALPGKVDSFDPDEGPPVESMRGELLALGPHVEPINWKAFWKRLRSWLP